MASSSKQNTNKPGVKESKESNASSLDPKTEAIHAFRTITTMLSLIQSTRGPAGNQENLVDSQLQLLDALAALLVRNNGVIAVTAMPYDDSGKVEVLASYTGNRESLITPQPQSASPIMNILRNFLVSQNPRDSTVNLKKPEVVDPQTLIPGHFKDILDSKLLFEAFLTDIW